MRPAESRFDQPLVAIGQVARLVQRSVVVVVILILLFVVVVSLFYLDFLSVSLETVPNDCIIIMYFFFGWLSTS